MTGRRATFAAFVALATATCAGTEAERRDAAEWVLRAAAASRHADDSTLRGDRDAARELLEKLVATTVPPRVAGADRRAVFSDAYFRLALIDLVERKPALALAFAERGLALGEREDLFAANLLIARGHALEALGRDAAAAESFHRALVVNEALLRAALGEAGGTE